VSHAWDTTDQTPEVSYRNLVQMPPMFVPALGGEPELYDHGVDGLNSLLCEVLDSDFAWIGLVTGTHSFLRIAIIHSNPKVFDAKPKEKP